MKQDLNMTAWLASEAYNTLRKGINNEVNKHKIVIDKSVFKKSPAERQLLRELKAEWDSGNHYLRS